MYSETALAVYSEMLKTAEADLVKHAAGFGALNPLRLFRSAPTVEQIAQKGVAGAHAGPSLMQRLIGSIKQPAFSGVGERAATNAGFENYAARRKAVLAARDAGRDIRIAKRLSPGAGHSIEGITQDMKTLEGLPAARRKAIKEMQVGKRGLENTHRADLRARRAAVAADLEKTRGPRPAAFNPETLPAAPGAAGAGAATTAAAPAAQAAAPAAGGGMGWKGKALLGAGGLGLGAGAYGIGRYQQGQEDKTQRNMAFGGGVAAGMAAPHLLRGIGNVANNAASNPFFAASQFQG